MNKTIYLAGAITGLDWYTAKKWRIKIQMWLSQKGWTGINPCDHIPDVEVVTEQIERECMQWELWQLRHSDAVICDFSHPKSIGTSWELATAYELGIPIIGLKTDETDVVVHPWWGIGAMHICKNMEELYSYLQKNIIMGG